MQNINYFWKYVQNKDNASLVILKILLVSAVICKQGFLQENDIVQYFQNYKYQDVNQGHFR